ncbi:hypothetical protein ABZ793_33040 [Micromonospora sp. NPDC047465]|uniref:hypothetical protein n=1 Tax=Micromonospora sp. NPDC047465 TaxID=3154813 RepID=UPI0034065398
MADDRLRYVLAERYGDPRKVTAEQEPRPLPPPAPLPDEPDRTLRERRKVLLDALRPKARAA